MHARNPQKHWCSTILGPWDELVSEIAHEQYGSALFIRGSCTCESTFTSSTDNMEIIQAKLNSVTVNSYYKPSNQSFEFRCSTKDTPLQMVTGDFKS